MRKILISLILIITILSSIEASFAFEIGQKEIYSKGECPRLLTYNGRPIKTTYMVYNHNGIEYPAYCLDTNLPGAEQGNYVVNGSSKLQNVEVWRAIINGYPYKSVQELGAANEQEAFTATKQAVYTMILGRGVEEYGAVDSDEGRRTYEIYKNIVNAARSSTENIVNNFNINIIPVDDTWKQDENQKNYVSKKFKVVANVKGNVEIFLQGTVPDGTIVCDLSNNPKVNFNLDEEFKVLLPIDKLTEDSNIDICSKTNLETKPVVYGSTTVSGTQNYALTGFWYEEIYTKISQPFNKNITKLRILKREYGTEIPISNVKFHLLDEQKNVIRTDLITNDSGEIILDNMFPGKYYLQEIETLEGYNLYTDLIEINLDLNEEFTVTVNNTKKETETYEKQFENVVVSPSNSEKHYYNSSSETEIESNSNTTKVVFEDNTVLEKNETNVKVEENSTNIVKKLPKTGY